jgi:hypothetical protein
MIATSPDIGERRPVPSVIGSGSRRIMQRLPKTTRAHSGASHLKSKGLGLGLALFLASAPTPAAAWTPWGAIARLFSGGNAVRQSDGTFVLRAVCAQANDETAFGLGEGRGFSTDPAARLDIASVFSGSGSLALAFGGGDNTAQLQQELSAVAQAAMPAMRDLLAEEIARYDFGDPLAVLHSEPGAAVRLLEARLHPVVKDVFNARMANAMDSSAAWARTAGALDRIGPGRMSRATLRALLDTASESATETVFRHMMEAEIALRRAPDHVQSVRARNVLRRMAIQDAKRGG